MRKATKRKVFLMQKLAFWNVIVLFLCFIFIFSQVFFAQRQFEYKRNATLQIIIDYK